MPYDPDDPTQDTEPNPADYYLQQQLYGAQQGGSAIPSSYTPPTQAPPPPPTQAPPPPPTQPDQQPGALDQYRQQLAERRAMFDLNKPRTDDGTVMFATPTASKQGAIKDFGDQVWASTLGMGQAVVGAASATARALGADPSTVQWIEQQRATLTDHISRTVEGMSPEAQQALRASIFGGQDAQGDLPSPGQVGWSRYLGAQLAGLVPQAALAVLPGGLVGRAVSKLAMAGLSAEAAATAGTVAGTAATAGAFGAVDAGEAYNHLVDQIDKAKPEELAQSPVYQHLIEQGVSDADARKQLVAAIAPAFVAGRFAAGAAAGAGLGGVAAHGALGAAERGALARMGIGSAEAGLTMGAQGAADTALQQGAEQSAGLRQGYDTGEIARAGASGALGGAVLGAGGGLLHGRTPERQPTATGAIAPDQQAALQEALKTVPGMQSATQGEMFQPGQMGPAQGDLPLTYPERPPVPDQGTVADPRQAAMTVQGGQPDLLSGQTQGGTLAAPPRPQPPDTAAGTPPTPPADVLTRTPAGYQGAPQAEMFQPHEMAGQPTPGAGMPGAAQPELALQTPPVAPPPSAPSPIARTLTSQPAGYRAGTPQAELFQPHEMAGQPAPGPGMPATARQGDLLPEAAPSGQTAAPAPAPEVAPTPTSRAALIKALVDAGQKKAGLAGLKLADLRDRYEALQDEPQITPGVKTAPEAAAAPPEVEASGQVNTTVVDDGRLFSEQPSVSEPPKASARPEAGQVGSSAGRGDSVSSRPAEAAEPPPPPKKLSPRELRKQQMQGGTRVEQQKGYVPSEAETTAPVPRASARSFEEGMVDMRDALALAGRNVVPLKAGDKAAVLRKAVQELTDLIGLKTRDEKAPTEGMIHEAIAQWGRSKSDPLPGSRTRRFELADAMLREMTGKGADDVTREKFRREAAAEPNRQPEMTESASGRQVEANRGREEADDAVAGENYDVGQKAEEEREGEAPAEPGAGEAQTEYTPERSRGVTDYGTGKARERRDTSKKGRVAGDILHGLLNGEITPEAADRAYGRKEAGTRGKPRDFNTFADYLREQIRKYDDPQTQIELQKQLEALQKSDATRQAKSAETNRITRELGLTDPDRLQQMKDHLAALEDPVGTAAENEAARLTEKAAARAEVEARLARRRPEQDGHHATLPDGILRGASAYVRAANDPRLNAFLAQDLRAHAERGEPYTLHKALRAIADNSGVKAEMAPMQAYARRLLQLAPDIPVLTRQQLRERDWGMLMPNHLGVYHREIGGRPELIALRQEMGEGGPQHVTVLLHEATHAVTANYIDQLGRADPQHRDLQALDAIHAEIRRQVEQAGREGGPIAPAISATTNALKNYHELHAELMTNPQLQQWLASRRASDGLHEDFRALGFVPREKGRSVWRFVTDWVRRAVGLPKVASASEYTLLDHILRPAQEITDNAARWRQEMRHVDPALRDDAAPLYFTAPFGDQAQRLAERALEHVDLPTVGDKARTALLKAVPLDAAVDRYQHLFEPSDRLQIGGNPLKRFRAATEAAGARTAAFRDKYADRVNGLTDRFGKLAPQDRDRLADLFADPRTGEVRLGDKADNSHLKTDAQKATLAEMQGEYARLSDDAKGIYQDRKALHADWYRQTRDAQLNAMIKSMLPELSAEQHEEITKVARTRKSIDDFLKESDSNPLAASFGQAWNSSRALARNIMKVHRLGFIDGDYFPLRRFGDYVIHYGSKETGDYGVEHFERRGEAEARRGELLKQDIADVSQVMDKRQSNVREILPSHPLLDDLNGAMRQRPDLAGHADDVRNLVSSLLLEHMTASERARAATRRKGVAGASRDTARVLAQEFIANSYRIGHLAHGAERYKALADMRLVRDDLGRHGDPGQQIAASAVTREMESRAGRGEEVSGAIAGTLRKATNLGFVQSLMSASHMLTSSIETHTNSTSLLGARHGFGRAGLALTRALRDAAPGVLGKGLGNTLTAARALAGMGQELRAADWNMTDLARDRFIARGADRARTTDLFDKLKQTQIIDHTFDREIRRVANGYQGAKTKAWERFLDLNAAGAHAVDVANKSAVAKAAYDLEYAKTGAHDRAVEYAIDTLRKVMPNYNPHNKAPIASGYMAPFMQFKNYGLHMYNTMANLLHQSMKGADPDARREAGKAFAAILATHALMAGSLTLIADPLRYVGGAWDFITGKDRPVDRVSALRGVLADWFGPTVGELVARGLPHAAGIDLHRRVGLENLLEAPELASFKSKDIAAALGTAMLGASGQDATEIAGGLGKLFQGDIPGAFKAILPRVLRDPMKAAGLASKGVTDSKGRTILPPDRLSAGDIAAQAVGFQPSRVSEFREGRYAVQQARQEAQDQRGRLMQAWLDAEPADRPAAMQQIQVFNRESPATRITMDQLFRQQQQQRKAGQGTFGIRLTPQAARQFLPAGRFANAQ